MAKPHPHSAGRPNWSSKRIAPLCWKVCKRASTLSLCSKVCKNKRTTIGTRAGSYSHSETVTQEMLIPAGVACSGVARSKLLVPICTCV